MTKQRAVSLPCFNDMALPIVGALRLAHPQEELWSGDSLGAPIMLLGRVGLIVFWTCGWTRLSVRCVPKVFGDDSGDMNEPALNLHIKRDTLHYFAIARLLAYAHHQHILFTML
jgi:hypothetical protein